MLLMGSQPRQHVLTIPRMSKFLSPATNMGGYPTSV